jgi:hypothetical protein
MFPIFRRHWPNASVERLSAFKRAILLAEDSAAHGRPAEGLTNAIASTVGLAGAALGALYGLPEDMRHKEALPADGNAGARAASIAKLAEKAATAASSPDESALLATAAFHSACKIADEEVPELAGKLVRDFRYLCDLAADRKWTDDTPVPRDVWQKP